MERASDMEVTFDNNRPEMKWNEKKKKNAGSLTQKRPGGAEWGNGWEETKSIETKCKAHVSRWATGQCAESRQADERSVTVGAPAASLPLS